MDNMWRLIIYDVILTSRDIDFKQVECTEYFCGLVSSCVYNIMWYCI